MQEIEHHKLGKTLGKLRSISQGLKQSRDNPDCFEESLITRMTCLFVCLFYAEQTTKNMSSSRNGTLEKAASEQTPSEARSPSRSGSGVVVPPPYSHRGSEAADPPVELRGSLDCWACSVLVTAQNLIIALINAGVASVLFGIILTPALAMITFGFLCHSTVNNSISFIFALLKENTASH